MDTDTDAADTRSSRCGIANCFVEVEEDAREHRYEEDNDGAGAGDVDDDRQHGTAASC